VPRLPSLLLLLLLLALPASLLLRPLPKGKHQQHHSLQEQQ
jgi:hypothetical protein